MTKEMSFVTTQTQESKNVTSKTSSNTKEVKSAPSLFDSMLSTPTESETNQSETKSALPDNNKENKVPAETSNTKKITKQESTLNTSLLDRLIMDANSSISSQENIVSSNDLKKSILPVDTIDLPLIEESVEKTTGLNNTSNNSVEKLLIDDVEHLNKDVNVDKPVLNSQEKMINESSIDKKNNKVSIDINSKTSLLDNLIVEANDTLKDEKVIEILKDAPIASNNKIPIENENNELETTNSVKIVKDSDNSTVVKNIKKEEIVSSTPEKNSIQITAVDDTLVVNESKNSKNQQVNTNNEQVEVKTEMSTDIKEVKKENTLLDKMVIDANIQIDKEVVHEEVQNQVVNKEVKNQGINKEEIKTAVRQNVNNIVENKAEVVQTQIKTVNEKVAQELSAVSANSNETVNISKDDVIALKSDKNEFISTKQENKSLLDKLIDNTKATISKEEVLDEVTVKTSVLMQSKEVSSEPILTTMYLSSQQKLLAEASMQKNAIGKQMAADGKSLDDIQKSADFLNLGLDESEVITKEEEFKNNVKADFLTKLSVSRDILKQDLTKVNEAIVAQSSTTTKESSDKIIELTVSPANVYNIENRIIGARQQMGAMMSDIARNMYLNYKPPVTAFRMNLNPMNLGSIAVLIKSEKDNGLSISLNMSNSSTLDSMVDNQATLRAALAKNFANESNFNLDFSMQDDASNNQNFGNKDERPKQNHRSTSEVLERLTNKEEQPSKKTSNYM